MRRESDKSDDRQLERRSIQQHIWSEKNQCAQLIKADATLLKLAAPQRFLHAVTRFLTNCWKTNTRYCHLNNRQNKQMATD